MIINGVGSRALVDFLKFSAAVRNIKDSFCRYSFGRKSLFMILFLIPTIEFFKENSMRIYTTKVPFFFYLIVNQHSFFYSLFLSTI